MTTPDLMEDLIKWNPEMLKQMPTTEGDWWLTQAQVVEDLMKKLSLDSNFTHELNKVTLIDSHADDYYLMVIELYSDIIDFDTISTEGLNCVDIVKNFVNSLRHDLSLTSHSILIDEDLTVITFIFTS